MSTFSLELTVTVSVPFHSQYLAHRENPGLRGLMVERQHAQNVGRTKPRQESQLQCQYGCHIASGTKVRRKGDVGRLTWRRGAIAGEIASQFTEFRSSRCIKGGMHSS